MRNSTSIQTRLAAIGGKPSAETVPSPPFDFMRAMLRHPDEKEAIQLVEEQAGLEFDKAHDGGIEPPRASLAELDERYGASKADLDRLEERRRSTKRFVKSGALRTGSEESSAQRIDFSAWRFLDQISMILAYGALPIVLLMSGANVYANLRASGNPVFIENPWLAICLSALAPAASTALKFTANLFELWPTRKRFVHAIFGLSALSLLVWVIFFSINFSGISGGIDWNSFGESQGSGAWLVFTQLVAEILVGSALFLAAEDIAIKYAPDSYVENIEFLVIEDAIKAHLTPHQQLRDARNAAHQKLVTVTQAHDFHVNQRIAEFLALRARFNAVSNF